MSSVIRGNVRMAFASIKRAKFRSGFTMFGVVIAVLPVLIISGIGEGVTRDIEKQIIGLGSELVTVRPGGIGSVSGLEQLQSLGGLSAQGAFSEKDVAALQDLKTLSAVSPVSVLPGAVEVSGKTTDDSLVIAANGSLPELLGKEVRYGATFDEGDAGNKVALLGRGAAEELFNEGAPLGRTFVWRGETFMVRGVLERFSVPPLSLSADYNNAVIIPYETADTLLAGAPVHEILIKPAADVSLTEAQQSAAAVLTESRGGKDFSVLSQADTLRIANDVLGLLTIMVASVAGIALLVAGIGIMNIMLVSVAERMQEIGIRKAIGATKQQIVDQFMAEAAVLTLLGALIGVIFAFIGQYFIGLFSPIQPFITWQAVLIVTGVSLLVGLLFGTIPAMKAARKDPIAALRNE